MSKLLFEDMVNMQNRWSTGMSGRNMGPAQLTIVDLLRKGDLNKQHPNNVQAPEPTPHGMEMMVELLGELYIRAAEARSAVVKARSNKILEDRPHAKQQLGKIINKISTIKKLVVSIGQDVDDFSIEKPKK